MRYYNVERDNCLQCCIANILDRSLDSVIDVSRVPSYWVDALTLWATESHVNCIFTYDVPKDMPYISVVLWDVAGCHAVICKNNAMIFNPNPSHREVYEGGLYNIIVTSGDFNEPIFKNNGEPICSFMDCDNVPKSGGQCGAIVV